MKSGCAGDTTVLKPATLLGVPLILDRIRKGITEKASALARVYVTAVTPRLTWLQVEGRGSSTKKLFNFALDYKNYWSAKGYK